MEQTRLVRRLLAMGEGGGAAGLVLEVVGGGAVCRNQIHSKSFSVLLFRKSSSL